MNIDMISMLLSSLPRFMIMITAYYQKKYNVIDNRPSSIYMSLIIFFIINIIFTQRNL